MSEHKDRGFKPLSDAEVTELLGGACDVYMETGKMPRMLAAENQELLAVLQRADKLFDHLFKAVPWGDTFDLDIAALNEVPSEIRRVLCKLKGGV